MRGGFGARTDQQFRSQYLKRYWGSQAIYWAIVGSSFWLQDLYASALREEKFQIEKQQLLAEFQLHGDVKALCFCLEVSASH